MYELPELKKIFKHFDEDGNGRIDRKEFSRLMDALGADMNDQEKIIGFDEVDLRGTGTIDFDEFSSWWND